MVLLFWHKYDCKQIFTRKTALHTSAIESDSTIRYLQLQIHSCTGLHVTSTTHHSPAFKLQLQHPNGENGEDIIDCSTKKHQIYCNIHASCPPGNWDHCYLTTQAIVIGDGWMPMRPGWSHCHARPSGGCNHRKACWWIMVIDIQR